MVSDMAVTPPFDQTEALAAELAKDWALTWREQVQLEAAINALYFELERPPMPMFVRVVHGFLDDIYDNVLYVDVENDKEE